MVGDRHVHGPAGVSFYARGEVVTSGWPEGGTGPGSLHFPTAT